MRVWLIKIGEPIPVVDGPHGRWMRTGLFAQALAARGHEVLWWTSAFEHARKRHRAEDDKIVQVSDSFRIWMMRSRGYRSGRSIGRILDHMAIARRFRRLAVTQPAPDIIVSGMPTPGLSLAAVEYGLARNVPVVLDMRDMWPECFVWSAPKLVRPLVYLASLPAARALHRAASRATAIVGHTRAFVEWGLRYAGRAAGPLDRDFPHGYPERSPDPGEIQQARQFWAERGISENTDRFIACFFGYMGRDFDMETVIAAAGMLEKQGVPVTFVLCGTGGSLERYKSLAQGLPNVVFPGLVSFSQIWTLMRLSSVGLAPYFNTKSFCASIPNKAIEYFSGSLPAVSSLQGLLAELLEENGCGVTYEPGKVEQLAAALRGLYESPERLGQMSAKAHGLFKKRFVAEKVYGEMVDYLEEVVASHRPD